MPPNAAQEAQDTVLAQNMEMERTLRALARSIALCDGFGLYLVSGEYAQLEEVIRATELECARTRAEPTRMLRLSPYDPSRGAEFQSPGFIARALLRALSTSTETRGAIVWLDATLAPPPNLNATEGKDDDEWRQFFRKMNEQRNDLSRSLKAPLCLVAPPRLVRVFAEEAPDFWSIRSLNVQLPTGAPVASGVVEPQREASVHDNAGRSRIDPSAHLRLASEVDENRSRLQSAPSDTVHRAALASALHRLSVSQAGLGRREQALEAAVEAVDHYRTLMGSRPDAFLADLALSLSHLSDCLNALARPEEALAAALESVDSYRALAQGQREAFLPELARSLSNLGNRLSALGRKEEALAATDEAVRIRRELAMTRPDVFEPDLACGLSHLGYRLSALGRKEEALAATDEAVRRYRALAQMWPDRFIPDVARGLIELGYRLSALGRKEEALAAAGEATQHYRTRAHSQPEFLRDVAWSLNNLSAQLIALQRREEALAATDEAVQHYRALAHSQPEFLRDVAWSLGSLAATLKALGRNEEASAAIAEAQRVTQQFEASSSASTHAG